MLEKIIDIVLYIPRMIYYHFEDYKSLKEENKKLGIIIKNQKNVMKRIASECEYYMTTNNYNSYEGFRKIKNLANIFNIKNENM